MTVGFEARNNNNNFVANAEYPGLVFCQKFTITASTSYANYGTPVWQATFTITGTTPWVAIAPNGAGWCNIKVAQSGNQWTYTFITPGSQHHTATIYVFDVPSRATTTNAGLQLFDSAGNLTFDAGQKLIKPVQLISNLAPGTSATLVQPASSLAIAACVPRFYIAGGNGKYGLCLFGQGSDGVDTFYLLDVNVISSTFNGPSPSSSYMMIDITGL